ncbi:TPA: hypothetical protein N2E68_001783 [Salmonella enterica]|nr:hypothetical protein [Salmonella enterica]HAK7592861.1 hypothetical protein [Salmonella enterica]HCL4861713.1 hypothetical protein [Salmonella enterica]
MLNLPGHIGRLRIVSLEQVALAMAGLIGECNSIETARKGNYIGWQKAETYREVILQAIKLKEIVPQRIFLDLNNPRLSAYLSGTPRKVDYQKIDPNAPIKDVHFYAKEIWPWASNELMLAERITKHIDAAPSGNNQKKNENNNRYGDVKWEPKFAGRKHALEIIAAQAILLAKQSGKKFFHGENISASAIADAVCSQLSIEDAQQHRRLIAEALKETSLADSD